MDLVADASWRAAPARSARAHAEALRRTRGATVLLAAAGALGVPCGAQETVYRGDVLDALSLADGTVAVAEEGRLLLVRPGGRAVLVDGSFESVTRIARAPDGGVVVWDDASQTAFVVRSDGVEDRAVPLADSRSELGSGERTFVGLLPGDVGLFEEVDPGHPFAFSSGPSRNPVRYKLVARSGSETVAWQALGAQNVVLATDRGITSAPVIFGYGALVANVVGGGFVVAQTEWAEAVALDAEGARTGAIPLPPPGPAPSRDQVERERERLIATLRMPPMLEDVVMALPLPPERLREHLAAWSASRVEALRVAPANAAPPRVSALRVDRERRVWMRRFAPPGTAVVVWDVRPLSGADGFSVGLPAAWRVFDAQGDRMLAGVEESGAVTRVVFAPIHFVRDRGTPPR